MAQGSGALGTASSSNLGGTIQFTTRRPTEDFGVDVAGTFGSEDTMRGFVRLDSGAFGPAGTRFSLSYADHQAEKWKGVGEQNQEQINASFVQPIGAGELTGSSTTPNAVKTTIRTCRWSRSVVWVATGTIIRGPMPTR